MNISVLADLIDEPTEYFQVIIGGNQTMQLAGARVVITDSGAEKGSLVRSESNGIVIQSAMVKEKVILHQ